MNKLNIKEFLKANFIDCYEIEGNKIRFVRQFVDEFIKYLDENNYICRATYKFGEWSEVEVIGYKVLAPIDLIS